MDEQVTAADVLAAVRRHHHQAAIVPEVVIADPSSNDYATTPTRRIDALMFRTLERTAIEIKVTRADYRRDTWQKRAAWQRVTHRFVYAVPVGLLEGEEMPYGCGVWEIHPSGQVTVLRKATVQRHPEPLPQQVVQSLAYRAARVHHPTTEEKP